MLHTYFCAGELAEWSIAAVLKTVDCYRSGGSNPSLSAKLPIESIPAGYLGSKNSANKIYSRIIPAFLLFIQLQLHFSFSAYPKLFYHNGGCFYNTNYF